MSAKELKTDANALMNLEMMDAVVGGSSCERYCTSCSSDCQPCCKPGCSHSGKAYKDRNKVIKRKKK